MALKLGWAVNDWRESYYYRDPGIDWDATPPDAQAAYMKDGDASHLVLRAGGEAPDRIRFRALTASERAAVFALSTEAVPRTANESDAEYEQRVKDTQGQSFLPVLLLAFRAGVDFPDAPRDIVKRCRVRGADLLDERLVTKLVHAWGEEIVIFYGGLVWGASSLSEDEKKTSPRA